MKNLVKVLFLVMMFLFSCVSIGQEYYLKKEGGKYFKVSIYQDSYGGREYVVDELSPWDYDAMIEAKRKANKVSQDRNWSYNDEYNSSSSEVMSRVRNVDNSSYYRPRASTRRSVDSYHREYDGYGGDSYEERNESIVEDRKETVSQLRRQMGLD